MGKLKLSSDMKEKLEAAMGGSRKSSIRSKSDIESEKGDTDVSFVCFFLKRSFSILRLGPYVRPLWIVVIVNLDMLKLAYRYQIKLVISVKMIKLL